MAERGAQLDSDKFSCSICLDLLKDPVTVPCGHSYCSNCIKSHWDREENKGFYSCPQCRKRCKRRPNLMKNIMLAELVEDLKKTGLQAASSGSSSTEPGDVVCDVCTGKKWKAVKFCLVCLVTYCEKHLQPHYESPAFKKHKLVEPSKNLQEKLCSRHNQVKDIFCRTDQRWICYLCMMEQHKDHETVSAEAERRKKQGELEVSRRNIKKRIQEREKDMNLLHQQMKEIVVSANKAVENISLIQKKISEVKHQLTSQQRTAVSELKELEEKLQREISELKRKDVQLERLKHTEDHAQFLHSYTSVSALGEPTHSNIQTAALRCFEDVAAAASESRQKLQDILRDTGTNTSLRATDEEPLLPQPQPETSADFLQYSQQITLDPNTVNSNLSLSDRDTKVSLSWKCQPCSDHPDRFTGWLQVLSRESLTGRCYWEVETRGRVVIAVSYKNISRIGGSNECGFGFNSKSWALCCSSHSFVFWHNNNKTAVSGPRSSRIGVYLDHSAGILSFHSISQTRTLLHRVQTSFTQPLYAGVNLYGDVGDSAKFLKPQ